PPIHHAPRPTPFPYTTLFRSNTDQNDALNASSNYGADTFLGAPGTEILTTAAGGGYSSVTGTSASAAEVAGAAALLRAADGAASDRKSTRLNSSHQIISYAVF